MKLRVNLSAGASLAFVLAFLACLSLARAQDFFQDKTIRILIPFSAGGGYDTYGRIIARHMKEHIPGNPDIIVQNMPGGGGLRASNYFDQSVKADGLTIGLMSRDMYFTQLTGQPGVMYDVTKWIPLGSAAFDNRVVFIRSDAAGSLDELEELSGKGKEIFVGATGVGDTGYNLWKLLETLVPEIKLQFVLGYPGMPETHLAIAKGEAMGSAQSKSGYLQQGRVLIADGKLPVIAQIGTSKKTRDPDFPDAPTFWELAETPKEKALVSVAAAASVAGRPFFLPAGVPEERVEILRRTFEKVAQDPKVIAEAEKLKRPIEYVPPEVIKEVYSDVFSLSPDERKEVTKLFMGQ